MSKASSVGGRRWSVSALIFSLLSIAGASAVAAIALSAMRVGALLGGDPSRAEISAASWNSAFAAAGVVIVVVASAAFTLRAAIVAPLSRLAEVCESGDEPSAEFPLADAARLAAGARRLLQKTRAQERDAAAERETHLRAELAAAEAAWAGAGSRLVGLESLSEGLARLARGDLTTRMSEAREVHPMAARLDQTVELFARTMLAFSASLDAIRGGAADIDASVDAHGDRIAKLSSGAESALGALAKGPEGSAELAAAVSTAAANLRALSEEAPRHAATVRRGGQGFGDIREAAKQIAPFLTLVDEIAFQMNFLALNAGVEAARVGDAGRGIAVVAQELRLLSQRAAQAAKESSGLLSRVVVEAERGAGAFSTAAPAYDAFARRASGIVGALEQTGGKLSDRKAAGEVLRTLSSLLTESAVARGKLRDEIIAETESLESLVGKLSALVDRFNFPPYHDAKPRASSRNMSACSAARVLPSPGRARRN